MDIGVAVGLSAPICVGLAAFGSGIGLGLAVKGALEAIGRQPSASNKILVNMIIGAALIEALTIYALIVFFILLGKMNSPTHDEVAVSNKSVEHQAFIDEKQETFIAKVESKNLT